jgi:putative Holliday junction resolvase
VKPKIRTILAFDYGLRQIGVAVGNCLTSSTQPLTILKAKDGIPQWHEVEKTLKEWQPDLIIVGDPLNMDGSDGLLGERARKFGKRVHGRFGLVVEMVDERLSSFEAIQNRPYRQLCRRTDFTNLDARVRGSLTPVEVAAISLVIRQLNRRVGDSAFFEHLDHQTHIVG